MAGLNELKEAAEEQDALAIKSKNGSIETYDVSPMNLLRAIANGDNYFWSSLVPKTHEEKLASVRLLTGTENNIEDICDPKYFDVANCIITRVSFTNEQGEVTVTPKLVLVNKLGKPCVVMAKVWITQFLQLFAMLGLPPWDKPIRVSAKRVSGTGTNKYYTLVLP